MASASIDQRRSLMKDSLDRLSDFVVEAGQIAFRHTFEMIEADETFCTTPPDIIDAARRLLEVNLDQSLAKIVHDNVTLKIGGNRVPLFAMVSGGRSRTLFSFRCVFPHCSAFLDVRTLPHANCVKWVIMGISHNHVFVTFPVRVPRGILTAASKEAISEMAFQSVSTASIRLRNDILCSKNILQNALREPRSAMRAEQARALRDAAMKSSVWSTQIHLAHDNALREAFFVNTALLSKCPDIAVVFMDDTSCTNAFLFPVVSLLCRDESDTVHTVAWGIVKNRTTSSFVRFLSFVSNSVTGIKTIVCDRHFAQRNAIERVFGDHVNIVHCAVHVARNIQTNTGASSDLLGRFWEMRFRRTEDAERAFVEALQRLHAARRSSFTAQLLHTLDSFIPSKTNDALHLDRFPELKALRDFDPAVFVVDSPGKARAARLLTHMKHVGVSERDVLSLDNTNTLEGHFSTLKSRMSTKTSTLLDVYEAVTFTERVALAANHPASPSLPPTLVDCLAVVLSREVLAMMSYRGVCNFLELVIRRCFNVISGVEQESDMVVEAVVEGRPIGRFKWMPPEWILTTEEQKPSFSVSVCEFDEENTPTDIMARLEPFLGSVNRRLDVFVELNNALTTLNSLQDETTPTNVVPACFSFFAKEFSRHVKAAETNDEVSAVLIELCNTLETLSAIKNGCLDSDRRRPSIVDPPVPRMRGPRTTTTSSRVDRRVKAPKTNMTDEYQQAVLNREKRPRRAPRKTHRCSVCLGDGHHPQTCQKLLADENAERANAFFKRLVETGKTDRFVRVLSRRATPDIVNRIVSRVRHFQNS